MIYRPYVDYEENAAFEERGEENPISIIPF